MRSSGDLAELGQVERHGGNLQYWVVVDLGLEAVDRDKIPLYGSVGQNRL